MNNVGHLSASVQRLRSTAGCLSQSCRSRGPDRPPDAAPPDVDPRVRPSHAGCAELHENWPCPGSPSCRGVGCPRRVTCRWRSPCWPRRSKARRAFGCPANASPTRASAELRRAQRKFERITSGTACEVTASIRDWDTTVVIRRDASFHAPAASLSASAAPARGLGLFATEPINKKRSSSSSTRGSPPRQPRSG